MSLLPLSFLAGVLTVLAPCVFPLLPVIIGGSLAGKNPWRPFVITGSLAGSILIFTLLLKATTALLGISPIVWKVISGGIVVLFGLTYLFPKLWKKISSLLRLDSKAQSNFSSATQKKGVMGMVLVGASLGPVFASCSPTYGVILATVLPQSFIIGLINLMAYAVGLALVMFVVAFFGQRAIKRMKWAVDPNGWFRRVLGILFLIVGLSVMFGLDKQFEIWVLDQGWIDATVIEQRLLDEQGL